MSGRVLCVDPGEKRIGLAISDPSATIANPWQVLQHVSRAADAAAIVRLAEERQAVCIVIGQALGANGEITLSARRAANLAEAIRPLIAVPVVLWDESGSTNAAQEARRAMGVSRRKRSGHLDEIAAVVILQSYLDAHAPPASPGVSEAPEII